MDYINNSSVPKTRTLISSPYFIFTLLFLLYMFDYLDRLVIVSLFPFLKLEWGIYGHSVRSARFRRILVDSYLYPACIHSHRQVEQD